MVNHWSTVQSTGGICWGQAIPKAIIRRSGRTISALSFRSVHNAANVEAATNINAGLHSYDHPPLRTIRDSIQRCPPMPLFRPQAVSFNGPLRVPFTKHLTASSLIDVCDLPHLQIFDAMPDSVVIVDASRRILQVNQAFIDEFGYEPDEVIGRSTRFLYADSSGFEELGKKQFNVTHQQRRATKYEVALRRRCGDVFWSEMIGSTLRDINGTTVGHVASIRDVTERFVIAEKIRQHTEQLESSNEELAVFAYAAAHDLRSPLMGVDRLIDFIKSDIREFEVQMPEVIGESIDRIQSRVQRMQSLLTRLLEYSQLDKQDSALERVSFSAFLDGVVQTIDDAPNVSITVTNLSREQGDEPQIVQLPRSPFERVLLNLISNAIKYHDQPNGRVEIRYAVSDDRIDVAVIDDGPGIPTEQQEKVFLAFHRLCGQSDVEGTGLGLAMVKKIIQSHGGFVGVQSNETKSSSKTNPLTHPNGFDRGTTFWFHWPIS